MFSGFSNVFLVKLSYFFTESRYSRFSQIFKEGQPVDHIAIVKQGEFCLSKKLNFDTTQSTSNKFQIKKNLTSDTEIAIVSKGLFCNEEDILNDNYMFTCTCVSRDGVILSINKSDLIHKILSKETEHTMNSLSHKKLLRWSQANSTHNIRKELARQFHTKDVDRAKATSKLEKRTNEQKNVMIYRGNIPKASSKKCLTSRTVKSSEASKCRQLLRFYKDIVPDDGKLSIERTVYYPKAMCQNSSNTNILERKFSSSGSSISWRYKFNKGHGNSTLRLLVHQKTHE